MKTPKPLSMEKVMPMENIKIEIEAIAEVVVNKMNIISRINK